jgi:hypothetical protein
MKIVLNHNRVSKSDQIYTHISHDDQSWNRLENGIPVRSGRLKNATGPAGKRPVGIICPIGEIPAKTGEKVTNFLEDNF